MQSFSQATLITPANLNELKKLNLRLSRQVDTELGGAFKSAFKGSGLTFAEYREYQPGDDVRHIHWTASARSTRVYVKDYEEERQCTFIVILDASRSTYFGGTESVYRRLCEFAALLGQLAKRNRDRLGLMIFDEQSQYFLQPKPATHSHYQKFVHQMLSYVSTSNKTDLATALNKCQDLQKRKAVLFILSDFHSNDFSQELKRLSLRHEVLCVHCKHQQEYDLPKLGLVNFKDAESGQNFVIDTSAKNTHSILAELQKTKLQNLKKYIHAAGADLINYENSALTTIRNLIKLKQKKYSRPYASFTNSL